MTASVQERLFPVVEVFGPVVQGEGELIGQRTLFVRFGGCDYRCKWCDSLHAVEPELVKTNSTLMLADHIIDRLCSLDQYARTGFVTISGGNPVMHDLSYFVEKLQEYRFQVALETQGTLYRDWVKECDVVTISPKPPSSGMKTNYEQLRRIVGARMYHPKGCVIKIVVFDDEDYEYAMGLWGNFCRDGNVRWYLQVGTDVHETADAMMLKQYQSFILNRTKWLWEKVCDDDRAQAFRVLPQLHSLVYGHMQGV